MAQRQSPRRREKLQRIARWRKHPPAALARSKASLEAICALEYGLVGRVVLPDDPEYDQDRQESNPAFQSFPQVIVYCEVESDIQFCLRFAQRTGMRPAIRSGGHSTAGFSVNEGIVIDVSAFSHTAVDTANLRFVVGTGTDFDTFNGALEGTGLHVPSGACGNVCTGGYVQGGGYGYTSRAYGMQSDCVLEFKVMLAGGGIVRANAALNSDLFWAMRGGTGGNFGVLLETTYRLVPLAEVWAFAISWNIADAAAALVEMQAGYMRNGAAPQLGSMINIAINAGQPVLLMQGMYAGTRAAGMQALASLLSLGSAQLVVDQSGTYPDMDKYLDDHPYPLPDQPDGACEGKHTGYIATTLAQADWQKIIDYFVTTPNAWSLIVLEAYGGAINTVPPLATAFVHRNVDMNYFIDVFWTSPQEQLQVEAWLAGFGQVIAPYLNGEVYQNYPLRGLKNFQQAYWGEALAGLVAVKQKYDPANFFVYEQSIPLSTPGAAPAAGFRPPGLEAPIVYERPPLAWPDRRINPL